MDFAQNIKPMFTGNERVIINQGAASASSAEDIIEVSYSENQTHLSVTAVLNYCKRKILKPYLFFLSLMGLRPLGLETYETTLLCDIISYMYMFFIIMFTILGYILQYMSCFRRDRGFCFTDNGENDISSNIKYSAWGIDKEERFYRVCHGSLVFTFIIPDFLHLFGYLYAVFIIRSSDDDQLPSLMERVFVSCSYISNGFINQKRLLKILWFSISLGIFWIMLSLVSIILLLLQDEVSFRWLEESSTTTLTIMKILLVTCTLFHDMVQATVISCYCLQAQLLTSYLQFLKAKLLESPVQAIEWMREIYEFKKLLKYLNEDLAPPVCFFLFINLAWTTTGILWSLGYDHIDVITVPILGINILIIMLWAALSLAPFFQAARLTNACNLIKSVGHEVRIRPFVHQDTPAHDLNSLLLFASSLDIEAKIFKVPIHGRYLAATVVTTAIMLLVLGEIHYLS